MNLPREPSFEHHPIDDIEPSPSRLADDAIYHARMKAITLLNAFAAHVEAALLRPSATLKDVAIAFYQPCYALGLNICDGVSVTERAEKWGVERASLSKGMTAFAAGNDLPPSFYMKSEEAQDAYRTTRILRVVRGKNK